MSRIDANGGPLAVNQPPAAQTTGPSGDLLCAIRLVAPSADRPSQNGRWHAAGVHRDFTLDAASERPYRDR